jgi:hypothetical protein
MTSKRVKLSARVLPDTAALIPMKAKRPEHFGQSGFALRRDIEPDPFADNLGQCVLLRQLRAQKAQN